MKFTQT